MKKGFIFSLDSMGAIAIVAALGIAWIMLVYTQGGNISNQVNREAHDDALVSLYSSSWSTDSIPDKNFYSCKKYFVWNDSENPSIVMEYQSCKGMS